MANVALQSATLLRLANFYVSVRFPQGLVHLLELNPDGIVVGSAPGVASQHFSWDEVVAGCVAAAHPVAREVIVRI